MAERIWGGVERMTGWIWDGAKWLAEWTWERVVWMAKWTWEGFVWMAEWIWDGATWTGRPFVNAFSYITEVVAEFYDEYLESKWRENL